ncbi:MAG TPA: YbaK/EbsC family protein [Polyangiaceae bacterium]|nr:YbaK/EbsC family protein [Polyangiaceae bacterium]
MQGDRVRNYLRENDVAFEVMEHKPTVTAQSIAQLEHESGWRIAKPVMLKLGSKLAMAVVPAPVRVDLSKVKMGLCREDVELAAETEYASTFPDCELGAEPPFGNLYGVPMFIDRALLGDPYLVFRDGTHHATLKTSLNDYLRVTRAPQLDMGILPPNVPTGAWLRHDTA